MSPAISIIMINRNRAAFIPEALSSLTKQDYKNWELIFIDDNSDDNSLEVIQKFLPDERIRIISNDKTLGIGKTRQEAVQLAKADIIGILDSDDALVNGALAVMIGAHNKNPQSLIYSQFTICDAELKPLKPANSGPIPPYSSNLKLNSISHFATFKKADYRQTSGYNPKLNLAEDKDIFYKLEEINGTLFIDQPLYNYRVHQTSVSNGNTYRRLHAHFCHLLVRVKAYIRRTKKQKLINIIKDVLDKYYFPFLVNRAKEKLNNLNQTTKTNNELWQVANNFYYGLPLRGLNLNIKPAQVPEEILNLMAIVKDLKPKVILEIGTATGGTLYFWTKLASPDATIISLDLPRGPFGGGYLSTRQKLMESFAGPNQKLKLIKANSHDVATKKMITELLAGQQVDFLFIDGDHSYLGVKNDWETYSPLVRPQGIVALHDILLNPHELNSQVNKFWQELKKEHKASELVNDYNQGWAGIGLIKL